MKCALCLKKECLQNKDCTNIEKVKNSYSESELSMMKTAAEIEAQFYMKKTRIEEAILFAKKMEYKKIGLAFCVGLSDESAKIHQAFKKYFEVYSVCCKVCGIDKTECNLDKINENSKESMCNPLGQAEILNEKETDLNIVIGLCIGHDILFTHHSNSPSTTLVVKDRVLAHNPLGAIYSRYYQNLLDIK